MTEVELTVAANVKVADKKVGGAFQLNVHREKQIQKVNHELMMKEA